jgi:uncharacterized protein
MKIIFDVNIWVSFGIGKNLGNLAELIQKSGFEVVSCLELDAELARVATYPKLQKYLSTDRIIEIFDLLARFAVYYKIESTNTVFVDAKDIYLLDLCDVSDAKYLITGDKPLLILQKHHNTEIISYRDFLEKIEKN